MGLPARLLSPEPVLDTPIGPTEEVWFAMSQAERDAFVQAASDAIAAQQRAAPEGRPHHSAKNRIRDVLGRYYQRLGRKIYLAAELEVIYPGQPTFCPDLMAVLDVEDPGEADERMAWIVAEERRGLDLVLEIAHRGDRAKDLNHNVEQYARLGIPEYFIYDRLKHRVLGYRQSAQAARQYEPIAPRWGMLSSQV